MGVKKEYRDYNIVRHRWKFWQIEHLEFRLSTTYNEAYQEVNKKLPNVESWSYELFPWVVEDIRQQLTSRVATYLKLAKRAKKLSVRFGTSESGQRFTDTLIFYVREGEIYFDIDDSIKREKLLDKLGI